MPSASAARPPLRRGLLKYEPGTAFHSELKARVAQYFAQSGKRPQGDWRLALKAVLIFAATAVSYVLLVFWASAWWQALPLMVLLGLGIAAIGFNIQHDGGHGASSRRAAWNRVAACFLDLVGGSSYVWSWKHNRIHHQYANVDGVDADIDAAPFLRLAPTQPHRFWHRFQHWYAWGLYGLLVAKWHLVDDFHDVLVGRVGNNPIPRPRGADRWVFWGGKLVFFSWVLGVPLLRHPLGLVLAGYAIVVVIAGIVLSTVFQLAHCVEPAEFRAPPAIGNRMGAPWAEHQLGTTVDFAQNNRVVTWFLGGLNFQAEHHLFPAISHVHYPALAPIVAEVCREHGVRYKAHASLGQALLAHVRWLERMGRPPRGLNRSALMTTA